jgi:hypothetical protein
LALPATIDRLLVETKIAAAGGKRRRVGFYSAVRREVPVRTFNDWHDPPPGFCEVDMVAHGGTSVAGSFIQTLTRVDVATGWTECMPLVTREGGLVVRAMERAQSLFPWGIRGADFDNGSAFMNDVVVPWSHAKDRCDTLAPTRRMIRLSSSRRTARSSGDSWETVGSMVSRRRAYLNVCMLHLGCTPTFSSRPSS